MHALRSGHLVHWTSVWLCVAGLALGAPRAHAQPAATDTITLERFIAHVSASHPVIRQARLGVVLAEEEQRVARGGFDPTVSAGWDRKTFGSVAYYDYLTSALTVPTPLGLDVKLGFERSAGTYISPDRRTPATGVFTAGLSVPLAQRLVTDERRTAVRVARALRDGAVAERDAAVNRVMLQAVRDYARWYDAERRASVAREGVALAETRMQAIRRRVVNGEAAPLDTVEAALEAERRRVQRVEAEQVAFAARLTAETHLWDARGLPDTLTANATPSAALCPPPVVTDAVVAAWVASAQRTHPEVVRAGARLDQAESQQRLASQQRLPAIVADVSALSGGGFAVPRTPSADDLKVGVSARSSLLLLKERGRANAAEARTVQQDIDRDRIRRDVAVAVRTSAADLDAVARSAESQRAAVRQARLLVRGEMLRLEAGEGTLFLVNTRERTLLDEEIRLAGIEARTLVVRAELASALGGAFSVCFAGR